MLATYPVGYLRKQELEGKFVDEGGIMGDSSWFTGRIIPTVPVPIKAKVRYWDLAATEKKLDIQRRGRKMPDPDETVGTLLSWDGENFYVEDQVSGAWEWFKIKEMIVATAQSDGALWPIYVEQEPAAGGKNQVAEIASIPELGTFSVKAHRPEGDKVMRANIWFAEAALGKVFLVQGVWNKGFLSQLSSFPSTAHDDKIDSMSGARLCVAPIRRWKRIPFLYVGQSKVEERKEENANTT
jgi:predicted phage terminase large subunit-like protein